MAITHTLVSVRDGQPHESTDSRAGSVSADGRFVVFESNATNLVDSDTNGRTDVFLKDLQTGVITRISEITDPVTGEVIQGEGSSFNLSPEISADGNYVVFISSANNLVPGTPPGTYVMRKHIASGVIEVVGIGDPPPSFGGPTPPGSQLAISADGRYVVYTHDNSTPSESQFIFDVFRKDMVTGTEVRVTTDTAGGPPNSQSYAVSISADGRFITYTSFASDLVAGDTNGTWDVFLYDADLGTTMKISNGAGASFESEISADGNKIVFSSDSSLVAADTNGTRDVYVWDRPSNTVSLASADEAGTVGNALSSPGATAPAAISADGRYVAFLSLATNLGGGPGGTGPGEPDGGDFDLFVKDLVTGEVRMVSVTPTGQSVDPSYFLTALDFTADGTKLVVDYSDSTGETAAPGDDNDSIDVILVDLFAPDVPPPVVSIAIAPTTAEEGSAFTLTATRTGADLSQPTTVTYTVTGEAANASDISTPLTGTITIPADETTATLTINSVEDTVFEAFEEFTVVISDPVNATLGVADAGAAIIDDDAPLVSISDASIVEGDAGTTILEFTVTKSFATAGTSQVQVTVADVTATEGVDYELLTPVVTFDDTATTGVVQVRVLGDTLIEPDETFEVSITEVTNGLGPLTIVDGTAIGTIVNDDAASLSVTDVSLTEGDAGTQIMTFTITRTGDAVPVTVSFATEDVTATAGVDYVATSGIRLLGAGETSETVEVVINGDIDLEADETFRLVLSNPTNGVTLADGIGIGTILDDDAAPELPVVSVTLEPASAEEGSSFTLTVLRTGADLSQPTTVTYTITGAAANASDISSPLSGTITLPADATSASVAVVTVDDLEVEPDEAFTVTLSDPVNATIGTDSASATILDNDEPPINVICGTDEGEVIYGTEGPDLIKALGGRDKVFAGDGDDVFLATSWDGSDHYCGGQGSDTADYSQLEHGVKVYLWTRHGNSVGEVWGRESGHDRLKSVENIVGSQASDRIEGNRKANVIEGEAGNDWLSGGGGPDSFVFRPGFGNDKILDFDPYARGGQDHIVLADFGITEADFHDRVEIVDAGRHTVITIDGDPDQTIRLVGVRDAHAIDMSDFAFAGGGLLET